MIGQDRFPLPALWDLGIGLAWNATMQIKCCGCIPCRDGVHKIEMHFLSDVYVKCGECDGLRFNVATLEVRQKGKSTADVLDLTILEAAEHFSEHPKIVTRL